MNSRILMGALILAGGMAQAATPIQGTVSERGIVAVDIPPIVRTQTNRKSPTAFEDEFRVRNGKDEDVPYVIRPRQVMRIDHETRWQTLQVSAVRETNGQLTVEAAWPYHYRDREVLETVRIDTPLTDFEQTVAVSAGGKEVARARLCDYSRFAQFRRTEFQLPRVAAERLVFTFSRPTSEQESATFERMIATRSGGKFDAQTVRRQVTERPFRVSGISVSYQAEVRRYEPAAPNWVVVKSERKEDPERRCTYFYFNAGNLPLVGLQTDFTRGNFDRPVALEVCRNHEWYQVHEGRFRSIDLGARQENCQSMHWSSPTPCEMCRLVVRNGDSPLLKGDPERLVKVACPAEEVVFIADPDEHYEGLCVAGATRPVYDEAIRTVLRNVAVAGRDGRPQSPVQTLRFDLPAERQSIDLPFELGPVPSSPNWLQRHGIALASAFVFVVLIWICCQLLGSGKSSRA